MEGHCQGQGCRQTGARSALVTQAVKDQIRRLLVENGMSIRKLAACLVPTGPRYTSGGLGKWAGKLSPLDIFNCICPHCPARAAEDPFAVSHKKPVDFCIFSA